MLLKHVHLFTLLSSIGVCFELRHAQNQFEEDLSKNTATLKMSGQYYEFRLGESNFPMKPIIDLETGLSYVFGKGCEEKDKCKRGDPPALFDLTKNKAALIDKNGFTYAFTPTDKLTGDIYSDTFKLGALQFNTTFGYVTTGSKTIESLDMTLGLGFGIDASRPTYKETIKTIFNDANKKGIIIKNEQVAGDGYIMFGELDDPACKDIQWVNASINGKSQQTWWLKFDKVTSTGGEERNAYAAFDFTTDDLTLPKSIYSKIGSDSVPSLKALEDINFEIGDVTFVLKPEDYTTALPDGRYRPNVQQSSVDQPLFKLGASFYRNKCIILNGENEEKGYKIGISQLPAKNGVTSNYASFFLLISSLVVGYFNWL